MRECCIQCVKPEGSFLPSGPEVSTSKDAAATFGVTESSVTSTLIPRQRNPAATQRIGCCRFFRCCHQPCSQWGQGCSSFPVPPLQGWMRYRRSPRVAAASPVPPSPAPCPPCSCRRCHVPPHQSVEHSRAESCIGLVGAGCCLATLKMLPLPQPSSSVRQSHLLAGLLPSDSLSLSS